MRRQALFFLVLAVLLGGLAAVLALQVLRPAEGGPEVAPGEVPSVEVMVAARDLPAGRLVTQEDVRSMRWPAEALPSGFSTSPSDVVGRGVLLPIRANEPLLSSKLALPEAGAGLPINIPEGMRALTFRVDDVVGVGGFVRPGHKVDVLVTADADGGEPMTRVVLQNIQVAATGVTIEPNPQGEPESVPHATFHLDPEQAERLVMASRDGSIQLALRNPLDADSVQTPGIRMRQVMAVGGPPAPAPRPAARAAPAAPRPPAEATLEIYRGPQRSTSTVDTSRVGGGGGGGL